LAQRACLAIGLRESLSTFAPTEHHEHTRAVTDHDAAHARGALNRAPVFCFGSGLDRERANEADSVCSDVAQERMTFRVQSYPDVSTFAERARPYLLNDEACNNLQLGLIQRAVDDASLAFDFAATVESASGQVLGVLTRTPGRSLIVSELPIEACGPTAAVLVDTLSHLTGVFGPSSAAGALAAELARRLEVTVIPHTRQGLLTLRTVNPPRQTIGSFKRAQPEHIPVILEWMLLFHEELPELGPPPPASSTENRLHAKQVFLWVDQNAQPVSMAIRVRESPRGGFIGYVYTPKSSRGLGFASNCVSHLSQATIDDGKDFCGLYVDLLNPISTRMYYNLGYSLIGESNELRLAARGEQC
jgi:uncharacterized protein